MVLIKTVSKTNSPLFCLSVIYYQKSLKLWKQDLFVVTEKISDLNSIYFHAKTILFLGLLILMYFGRFTAINYPVRIFKLFLHFTNNEVEAKYHLRQ